MYPVRVEVKVTFSTVNDLKTRYSNRKKTIKVHDKEKQVSWAALWLEQKQRREYDQVVFAPGKDIPDTYNLWRGFAVTPDSLNSEVKSALYLPHIRDNICQGNDGLYKYIVKWMANGV